MTAKPNKPSVQEKLNTMRDTLAIMIVNILLFLMGVLSFYSQFLAMVPAVVAFLFSMYYLGHFQRLRAGFIIAGLFLGWVIIIGFSHAYVAYWG